MRIVIDTSVIVSGLLSPHASPAQIVTAWREGRFVLLYSQKIYIEYEDVLKRAWIHERLRSAPNRVAEFLEAVRILGDEVIGFVSVQGKIRDPFDEMFLQCAQLGHADYLVSTDKDLLSLQAFQDTTILTPGEFVAILSANADTEE